MAGNPYVEAVRVGVADYFVPSVLVLASPELDDHFRARTGLTVAHFLQYHTYARLHPHVTELPHHQQQPQQEE